MGFAQPRLARFRKGDWMMLTQATGGRRRSRVCSFSG